MSLIVLRIEISESNTLKGVTFDFNDTGLQSGKGLLESIAMAILRSKEKKKNDDDLNALLN